MYILVIMTLALNGVTIESIDGFKTRKECNEIGTEIKSEFYMVQRVRSVNYTCVYQS